MIKRKTYKIAVGDASGYYEPQCKWFKRHPKKWQSWSGVQYFKTFDEALIAAKPLLEKFEDVTIITTVYEETESYQPITREDL